MDIAKKFNRTHGTLLRQLHGLSFKKNNAISKTLLEKIQTELDAAKA